MTAGYSGTPLVKKLGIKPGMPLVVIGAPEDYAECLGELPAGCVITSTLPQHPHMVHLFTRSSNELDHYLRLVRPRLQQDGMLWVSWPKKASKLTTEVDEHLIRELALPLGWVDIKVCAVNETWSGLKLVIRKTDRVNLRVHPS
jgi:hypothetical protein